MQIELFDVTGRVDLLRDNTRIVVFSEVIFFKILSDRDPDLTKAIYRFSLKKKQWYSGYRDYEPCETPDQWDEMNWRLVDICKEALEQKSIRPLLQIEE